MPRPSDCAHATAAPPAAAVRGRLPAALPPGAAAVRQEGRAGPAAEEGIRAVDVQGVRPAGEAEIPAWRPLRCVRAH
ncbi:hypothetical protein G6F59_017051 [Rhizopus arrhizus]|nr:hypothetical protein G6F59_017051 [Rhizopus arrhizus]